MSKDTVVVKEFFSAWEECVNVSREAKMISDLDFAKKVLRQIADKNCSNTPQEDIPGAVACVLCRQTGPKSSWCSSCLAEYALDEIGQY